MADGSRADSVAVVSLGCRVGRADAGSVTAGLAPGFRPAAPGEEPDWVVVSTCSVTTGAAASSRQAVRRAAREHPGARIVGAGPGESIAAARCAMPAWNASPRPGTGAARPVLKIQDGCDDGCAYCAVPLARGASRSLPLGESLSRIAAHGRVRAEVVLSGVHLGAEASGTSREYATVRFPARGAIRGGVALVRAGDDGVRLGSRVARAAAPS